MALIDPTLVLPKVLSRRWINKLNALYDRLEARKVAKIAVPRGAVRIPGEQPCAEFYCQSHLRRCLVLARSAYGLFFLENGLVSLICVRGIYETVAVFSAFEQQFLQLTRRPARSSKYMTSLRTRPTLLAAKK